jgi:hypothetical protein
VGPLVGCLALIPTAIIAYQVIAGSGDSTGRDGASLLPAATCAYHSPDPDAEPTQRLTVTDVEVGYSASGCNAATPQIAQDVAAETISGQRALSGLGLPRTKIFVRLAVGGERVIAYPSPGRRGALILDTQRAGRERTDSERVGVAELEVAWLAPGMDVAGQARVSTALALLSSPTPTASLATSAPELRAGTDIEHNAGLFDAWLTSRFGVGLLRGALLQCRRHCVYSTVLARELVAARADISRLAQMFLRRAVDPRQWRVVGAQIGLTPKQIPTAQQ